MQKLVNLINDVSEKSFKEKKKTYLIIDLDNQKYLITEKILEENSEIENNLPEEIFIFKAKNSTVEKESGTITFTFFPDRTKEFGMIYLENKKDGKVYTLFLEPYSTKTEIYDGEVYFENF